MTEGTEAACNIRFITSSPWVVVMNCPSEAGSSNWLYATSISVRAFCSGESGEPVFSSKRFERKALRDCYRMTNAAERIFWGMRV
jgi:hypothetical protein